jgi:hypothetical protein
MEESSSDEETTKKNKLNEYNYFEKVADDVTKLILEYIAHQEQERDYTQIFSLARTCKKWASLISKITFKPKIMDHLATRAAIGGGYRSLSKFLDVITKRPYSEDRLFFNLLYAAIVNNRAEIIKLLFEKTSVKLSGEHGNLCKLIKPRIAKFSPETMAAILSYKGSDIDELLTMRSIRCIKQMIFEFSEKIGSKGYDKDDKERQIKVAKLFIEDPRLVVSFELEGEGECKKEDLIRLCLHYKGFEIAKLLKANIKKTDITLTCNGIYELLQTEIMQGSLSSPKEVVVDFFKMMYDESTIADFIRNNQMDEFIDKLLFLCLSNDNTNRFTNRFMPNDIITEEMDVMFTITEYFLDYYKNVSEHTITLCLRKAIAHQKVIFLHWLTRKFHINLFASKLNEYYYKGNIGSIFNLCVEEHLPLVLTYLLRLSGSTGFGFNDLLYKAVEMKRTRCVKALLFPYHYISNRSEITDKNIKVVNVADDDFKAYKLAFSMKHSKMIKYFNRTNEIKSINEISII